MKVEVPSNFPEALEKVAFVCGQEAAWEQKDCLSAIDWLSKNGYAVLGFELWLPVDGGIRTAISTRTGPAIFVGNCDPMQGETWENYVRRSARQTAEYIGRLRWPEDSLEPRPTVF